MNSVRSLNRWYSSRSRCTDSVAVYSEVFDTSAFLYTAFDYTEENE